MRPGTTIRIDQGKTFVTCAKVKRLIIGHILREIKVSPQKNDEKISAPLISHFGITVLLNCGMLNHPGRAGKNTRQQLEGNWWGEGKKVKTEI